MAPSRGKGGGAAAEQAKERLTAVVMADSFTQRFRPVTAEHPKVLLPLVNVPMLDYTLEWLSMNSVEEVYIFCCAHADAILAHITSAGWSPSRRMLIHPIISTNCLSLGDALRLLDEKDVVKTDFVLVSGDVVTNMRLGPAMDEHRRRRAADKSSIMTLVMRGGMTPANRVRLGASGVTTVLDSCSSRLLKFEENVNFASGGGGSGRGGVLSTSSFTSSSSRRGLRLDAAFFSERDAISVRSDLIETGIYICAPEVLMLFSDNFDYQNIRRDFVSGVLSEEELGNKLFVHEVAKEYVARVHSLRSYDAVSLDILARWTYPLVPDTNLFGVPKKSGGGGDGPELGAKGRRTRYRYNQGMVYLDEGVITDRSSRVTNTAAIGTGTYIAAGATLEQTVVGRDCHIGAGAILRGCYLGDGVVIGAKVVATSAILFDGVVVKESAQIEPNVVLSYRVVVDRRTIVPAGARVSLIRPPAAGNNGEDTDEELEVPHQGTTTTATTTTTTSGFGQPSSRSAPSTKSPFASSMSEDSDEGEESCCFSEAVGGPDLPILQAASALAANGIPETAIEFSIDVVGPMGAGFLWPTLPSELAPEAAALVGLELPVAAMERAQEMYLAEEDDEVDYAEEERALLADEASVDASIPRGGGGGGGHVSGFIGGGVDGGEGRDGRLDSLAGGGGGGGLMEPLFKREVAETFLRCVKENISHENVVIELNGLKIAEDKTFADCARFMLTTALGLCLPPPTTATQEYRSLYNSVDVDAESKEGKVELLKRVAAQLRRWKDLLCKFLKNEEDQVELLLTLEEFCGEEGDFEGTGERGASFTAIFPQLLKLLYELDVTGEEAILTWAAEKQHAEEEELRFLRLAQPFIDWLEEAEEESSEDEEDEDDDEEED